jgi:Arc/MetJ-type ribon-helix-helix transcriptional regulator
MAVTLTFPDELQQFIDLCVAEGFYADAEDVVRDAVRHLFAEMNVDEDEDLSGDLPVLSAADEADAALASLNAATVDLGVDSVAVQDAVFGDALLGLLGTTQTRLQSLLEAVERDIAASAASGVDNAPVDVSTGIGSPEGYITTRIPRSDEPGVWRSQALAAPRGPLLLDDIEYARGDLLLALSEVNLAKSRRLQSILSAYGRGVETASNALREASEVSAAIAARLR